MMEASLPETNQAKPLPDHAVQFTDTQQEEAAEKAPPLPDLFLHDIAKITPPAEVEVAAGSGESLSAPEAVVMAKALPTASPATIYIDPTAAASGDGSVDAPFRSWHEVTWQDGTTYLQKAGTAWEGNIIVSGGDISIGSYGSGAATLLGSVVFEGATGGGLAGFDIRGSDYAGVTLTAGARGVTISDNTITGNAGGIWFSQNSGGDNVITGNSVSGNLGVGIALDRVATTAGHGNRIEGNTVSFNGSHGIDVYANNTLVDGNTVFGNGRLIEGASGIHVYARALSEGLGRDNVISGNVSYGNLDSGGNDGIGILLDHYTSGNRVENNFAFSNDGAGISIHGAAGNTVAGNTLFGNLLDRSDSHTVVAELLINSNPALGNKLTHDNVITDNTVLSDHSQGFALYVDVESAPLNNAFDGNLWQSHMGPLVQDGTLTLATAEALSGSARHGEDRAEGFTLAAAPVGEMEHDLNGLQLILDGRPAELEGWDSTVGLVGDWLLA
ncbi:right-handed parallel beta-helix repeat-containing protein [Haematobacter sp. UBA3484]|uniref:right-handed parallel beta-helix repeat-containing protein n=1 Tax=Haematobacter sp. UBA3484 TaxID=1946582 RepID=UPI0025B8A61F|nr:right-handed parallel beta-helix repeat-containing protein [Haematobacter sp. UBA3484]